MIVFLRQRATKEQLAQMLEALEVYVKVAVDISRGIVAGGGVLHADCEAVLRPRQNNPSMTILDRNIRERVERVVRGLLEDV